MLRRLRQLWRSAKTGACFLAFFSGGTLLSWIVLPMAQLFGGPRQERIRRCQRMVGRTFVWFHDLMRHANLIGFDSRKVHLDLPSGPFVMVANHPTLVDVTALLSVNPELSCVVKPSHHGSPLLGPLLRSCGHLGGGADLFSGVELMRQALAHLGAGMPVLIFPEGTRSPEKGLHPFKLGAFQIAARAGVPLVPVLITCDPPALMRGQPWYIIPERLAQMRITTLPAIAAGAGEKRAAADLEQEYRRRIEAFYRAGEAQTVPAGARPG